jgi:hypothetical protein
VKPALGKRTYANYLLVGWEINGWLTPLYRMEKDKSKYTPHQGMKECLRRHERAC